MKKIILLLLIVPLFGLSSCKDLLTVIPENSVTFENAIRSEKDVESMVTSIRSMFRDYVSNWSNKSIYWRGVIVSLDHDYPEDFTNEFVLDAFELGTYTNTATAADINWRDYYSVLATAHVVLDNAKNAEGVPADRMKFYVGQAYFYRAYLYFTLAQSYGEVPIITHGRDVSEKTKSTWEDVIQQVFDDAQKAIEMLPPRDQLYSYSGAKINSNDVPCYESACMLKALACAWRASLNRDIYQKEEPELYVEAIELATKVIDSPSFGLVGTSEQVCTEVLKGGSREGIFEVHNDFVEMGMNSFTTARLYATWPIRTDHEQNTIAEESASKIRARIDYKQASGLFGATDPRRNAYFYKLDEMGALDPEITGGFSYPYKFRNGGVWDSGYEKGTFKNFNQDHVIYRLADIILLRAECCARTNQTGLAIADLKRVRDRAYGVATVYPQEGVDDPSKDLRFHIFKERERELLWEDQRYFDIIRNGYYNTEINSDRFKALTVQDVKDGAIYLPVANSAMANTLNITQNRYWDKRFREK